MVTGKTMARLSIKVTPGARSDQFLGYLDDGETLRIKLRAPAVDGKANKALVEFVANWLRVPKSAVSVLRGEKSRIKVIEIAGVEDGDLKIE